ncbi:dehydrin COR410-like [Rutidosis leptorrhynchoides]|uniref:dehydrin COR410-like n=1 Tax=Rutidosis leptorrhynchoides TaxID=125765 RepID=UPI003A9A64A8
MSDEVVYHDAPKSDVEQSDRGLFDFMGKKKEENKCDETTISSEFEEKVQVNEPEHKESLLEKLHRDGSSSSSSSDEECEDGEKKKKKKPLKDTIKEKIEEHKEKKEEKIEEDTCVPVEKYEVAVPPSTTPEPEEKKGFMDKIKEKLPGGHKKVEEQQQVAPPPTPAVTSTHDDEQKEKKGIFEKIKEKIPGYHGKSEEEKEKEKVKECD